jgi:hypothetical protein
MVAFEKIEAFEEQTLQTIAFNMCKWFGFDRVIIENQVRNNVESGIWITVTIEWDAKLIKRFSISAQRNDLIKERLIKWLRSHLENATR